jgi:hypothetical protein
MIGPSLLLALLLVATMVAVALGALRLLAAPGPALVRVVEIACIALIMAVATFAALSIINSLINNITVVEVPLEASPPQITLPGYSIDPAPATIVAGGADRATITVSGLSWVPRAFLAATAALQAGVAITIIWTIRTIARQIRAGQPFDRTPKLLMGCALLLFAGAFTWAVLGDTGAYFVGQEALEIHGSGTDQALTAYLGQTELKAYDLGWPQPANWQVNFPILPFGVAFGLALLSLVFATGQRLQEDTEGLV